MSRSITMSVEVIRATTVQDITKCLPVFRNLMPFLPQDDSELIQKIQTQEKEGYKLVFIKDPTTSNVVSILGYRILNILFTGKTFYIDDICTLPGNTGKGFGGHLLDWAIEEAKKEYCQSVDLDSGYTRHDAHKLYLNHGFKISRHHFHIDLKQ